MRYIKSYKIFESDWSDRYSSNNEFMQQISEILLDLNDDGFGIITASYGYDSYSTRLLGADGDDFVDISRITVEVNDNKRNLKKNKEGYHKGFIDSVFSYQKIEYPIGHLFLFMKDSGYFLSRISLSNKNFTASDNAISKGGVSLLVLKNLEIHDYVKFYFRTIEDQKIIPLN